MKFILLTFSPRSQNIFFIWDLITNKNYPASQSALTISLSSNGKKIRGHCGEQQLKAGEESRFSILSAVIEQVKSDHNEDGARPCLHPPCSSRAQHVILCRLYYWSVICELSQQLSAQLRLPNSPLPPDSISSFPHRESINTKPLTVDFS